jgi:hypothetical protein
LPQTRLGRNFLFIKKNGIMLFSTSILLNSNCFSKTSFLANRSRNFFETKCIILKLKCIILIAYFSTQILPNPSIYTRLNTISHKIIYARNTNNTFTWMWIRYIQSYLSKTTSSMGVFNYLSMFYYLYSL